jgi:DNA-binding XRE family transcriptional regulator
MHDWWLLGALVRPQRAYTRLMPVPRLPLDLARLKTLRLRAALSQRELAQRAGIAESTYRGIELGQHDARPSTVRKLARALGCQPTDLMLPDRSG